MNERLHVALLLAVTMLVYGNTLLNSFTLDDGVYILSNPAVTGPSVRGLFEPDKTNHIFRPVTFATFALNWAVGGANRLAITSSICCCTRRSYYCSTWSYGRSSNPCRAQRQLPWRLPGYSLCTPFIPKRWPPSWGAPSCLPRDSC